MMTATAAVRAPWHPPKIWECIDHTITPRAGRLKLSSRHPKKEHTDHVRAAEMNLARVDGWRERQYDIDRDGNKTSHFRSRCMITYDGDVLDMLVDMREIRDNETGDAKIVGEAISDMLAEAAQDWKAKHF
jgi:hypothetical protein